MEIGEAAYKYRDLYAELENYEKNGVPMHLEGSPASPMQIVTAHMIREEGCYMRDYVMDEKGYIESLIFVNINYDQAKNPLNTPEGDTIERQKKYIRQSLS
ncbi:hypothetical protein [Clostridium sp. C105KSO13]|uniref:hypothetical protein n=1 Tax=Clostridium sp. C105KSO13 TaxID=1776045 RepID=UPI0007405AAD|nr:hypothetical protein [Clostridium sp. C105KSO13]CUX37012.1 hypothetical protein BN3456_01786 [Clostridium sp. C105KSO13]